jgi:hypothetical protein
MKPRTHHYSISVCLLAAVACLAGARPAAAMVPWRDTRMIGPFLCHADFPLDGAEALLRDLGRLQTDLQNALGIQPPRESIEVYLFHDANTYARYLRRYFPEVPYRRALYMKGRGPGRVFAYWSPEFEVDLRHEATHALLHASLPSVPLWLDEGLAVYFEVPSTARANGSPRLPQVRASARLGLIPNLAALEQKDALAEMHEGEYRAAWAWVHFMLHGPPAAHQELVNYLAALNVPPQVPPQQQAQPQPQPPPPPMPLSARLQTAMPDVGSRFLQHYR